MIEPKAFASLSSGLLARKGGAKPAMRPQGFGQPGASLEDLGWNDMGFEAPKPAVALQPREAGQDAFGAAPARTPASGLTPSPVHGQQAELAHKFGQAADEHEDDAVVEQVEAAFVAEPEPEPVAAVAEPVAAVAQVEPAPEPRPLVLSLRPAAPGPAPVLAEVPTAVRAAGTKAAFTLRLDAARHLRLRLACALTGRSAQMLVTQAVDKLLADYPELETFAEGLPDGGQARRAKG